MNFETPSDPRQALEPSLTALLLGELPEEQARFLRQAIATDPELARTFERLKSTTALLNQLNSDQGLTGSAAPNPLPKLSEERRALLLQQFKTVRPVQMQEARRPWNSWVAAAAALVMGLAVVTAAWMRVSLRGKPQTMASLDRAKSEIFGRPAGSSSSEPALRAAGEGKSDNRMPAPVQRGEEQLDSAAKSRNSAGEIPAHSLQYGEFDATASAQDQRARAYQLVPQSAPAAVPRQTSELGYENLKETPQTAAVDYNSQAAVNQAPDPSLTHYFWALPPGGALPPQNGQAPDQTVTLADTPQVGDLFTFQKEARASATHAATESEQLIKDAAIVGGRATERGTLAQGVVSDAAPSLDGVFRSELRDAEKQPSAGAENLRRKLGRTEQLGLAQSELNANLQNKPELQPPAQNTVPGLVEEKAILEQQRSGLYRVDDELTKKQEAENLSRFDLNGGLQNEIDQNDVVVGKPATQPMASEPEVQTSENAFSTFSLNVSDVSFQLTAASLEKGKLPDPSGIRSEEFINAFDYRDAEPAKGQPVAFAWERARYPFAQNRDLLRLSVKTAAAGREEGRPLNIVLLLDNSGSMERADRVAILHEALRVLASQLHSSDVFSVVTFARKSRLYVDGVTGDQAGQVVGQLDGLTPQGGTNLEEALNLAYQTARRHYLTNGINRVVLLTDGAANLGDTNPEALKLNVESNRKQGIALDCFGVGWEGYDDDMLERLARNGDGRYGFLNSPEQAVQDFAGQLAGALHVAASDVKVQVEFNPQRVTAYRQIGYARHQLTRQQFRDNTVDAAELGAAEAGNALYVIQTNPQGNGPLATIRVRYKVPGTSDYHEHEWFVPFTGSASSFEQSSPSIRLAGTAAAFSEWLASSPYAAEVAPDRLIPYLNGVAVAYGADPRPQKLEWMIRQAAALSGK